MVVPKFDMHNIGTWSMFYILRNVPYCHGHCCSCSLETHGDDVMMVPQHPAELRADREMLTGAGPGPSWCQPTLQLASGSRGVRVSAPGQAPLSLVWVVSVTLSFVGRGHVTLRQRLTGPSLGSAWGTSSRSTGATPSPSLTGQSRLARPMKVMFLSCMVRDVLVVSVVCDCRMDSVSQKHGNQFLLLISWIYSILGVLLTMEDLVGWSTIF